MNPVLRTICRADRIPLAIRRRIGRAFVPYTDEEFSLDIDGVLYRGRLDSSLEWIVWVTGRFFEYTYLNLIRTLRLRGAAVDVGANVGNHALAFSTMFDEVIAVEPYEPLYRRLEEKVRGFGNVRIHRIGLGSEAGRVGFLAPTGRNTGTGHVAEGGADTIELVRGDDFLAAQASGPIGFIKIDVEGYEGEVLQGLSGTLEAERPVVFYEAFRTGGMTRSAALLSSFGYFPPGYDFWGLRGQTTFPLQRSVARPVRITDRNVGRRYAYVLALPRERSLPGS
jgi:FkbM family methyltransferase